MIDKSMAEAQCLNQSFEFGLAEQQISKPFTMLLDSGIAVIQNVFLKSYIFLLPLPLS